MKLWRRIFAERRAVLVPLVALLIIDAAVLAAAVFPLKRVVESAADEADQARIQLALSRQRMLQMQSARSSRDRAEQELAKFYGQILPSSYSAAVNLAHRELPRLAKENGLVLGNLSLEPEDIKDSPLRRLRAKFELKGDYTAISRFLYDVETSEAFLVINSVSLAQDTRQQQQGAGMLQLSLEMATYFRAGAQ
jgi:Tfp pilus assembly protein PilO